MVRSLDYPGKGRAMYKLLIYAKLCPITGLTKKACHVNERRDLILIAASLVLYSSQSILAGSCMLTPHNTTSPFMQKHYKPIFLCHHDLQIYSQPWPRSYNHIWLYLSGRVTSPRHSKMAPCSSSLHAVLTCSPRLFNISSMLMVLSSLPFGSNQPRLSAMRCRF